jgi:hypothetical protein
MVYLFLVSIFSHLPHLDVDFLFGLDLLKRHRCVIGLSTNTLRFDWCGVHEMIKFLDESQLILKDDISSKI